MNAVGVDYRRNVHRSASACIDGDRHVQSIDRSRDPTRGVADTLDLARLRHDALGEVLHGSTLAINTVLERKGARTALITTKGFRDVYAIGRGNRIEASICSSIGPSRWSTRADARSAERDQRAGRVLCRSMRRQPKSWRGLLKQRVEAVAVCLLHAMQSRA
jgi:N-methylhydantoinase A